jgi:hypothetical protein
MAKAGHNLVRVMSNLPLGEGQTNRVERRVGADAREVKGKVLAAPSK